MNFLVILIVSLVVFGFGIRFIYKLGAQATKLESMTAQQLDQRIGSLLCESEKTCLGIDRKTVKRNDVTFFGLKVINILDSQPFSVKIDLTKAFDKNGDTITTPPPLTDYIFHSPDRKNFDLNRNEERNIGIGVEVLKIAKSGTYVFNVAVCYNDLITDTPDSECGGTGFEPDIYSFKKFYVEVP